MKNRAIILLVYVLCLSGLSSKTLFCQDTIISGSFPVESLHEIFTQALIEHIEQGARGQVKTDSFFHSFEILLDHMKNLTEVMVVPDDIATSYGNDFERDASSTTVSLNGESRTREIAVNVKNEIPVMFIIIKGGVKSGNINVEILDPNGKKYGGFSIGSNETKNGEMVNGSLNKTIQSPAMGKWAIKIDSDKATGNMYITSIQKLHETE